MPPLMNRRPTGQPVRVDEGMEAAGLEEICRHGLKDKIRQGVAPQGLLWEAGPVLLTRFASFDHLNNVVGDSGPVDGLECPLPRPDDSLMRGVQLRPVRCDEQRGGPRRGCRRR